ncbi:hypothetical protein TEPIDINF_000875 [Tepidibacillus infernus]|uniref:Uncharacterized protein n=1 Tax=Tepidibacillus decaturensis TaxID=1413211 RepID=A0A135L3B4_9BACI|nr:hypothetical protein [Tepidibacillus decaturensis]KXG43486.1 hypothetical protein U473_05250 [Tepidibacillus decaturensis]
MIPGFPNDIARVDPHFFPQEEYQISRVNVNESTGREEVLHYSYGRFDDFNPYHHVETLINGYLPYD